MTTNINEPINVGDTFIFDGSNSLFTVTNDEWNGWDWDAHAIVIKDDKGNETVIDTEFFCAHFTKSPL